MTFCLYFSSCIMSGNESTNVTECVTDKWSNEPRLNFVDNGHGINSVEESGI